MGLDAHLLQPGLDLLAGGGLAAAGGAGQQHDVGAGVVVRDLLGGPVDFSGELRVPGFHEALGIAADGVVDVLEGIGHGRHSPFSSIMSTE